MNEKQLLKDTHQPKIFAVSGGPDSMFMLDKYRQVFRDKTIIVVHVNYNFRNDSFNDQKIVETYCQKYNLKFELKVVDSKIYQQLNQNFEEFARTLRYDFFTEIARKYGSKVVFVAHNQNDLVETYLLQKARQNQVTYYGLTKLSQRNNLWIYRPLLELKKSFILNYNDMHQIPYYLDKTNFDQSYARNKIRANLKESELDLYIQEIVQANKLLESQTKQVEKYLLANLNDKVLNLRQSFFKFNDEVKKRILYTYFQKIGSEQLILNRKKQTLNELVKLVNNQTKPVLELMFKQDVVVKDFNQIYVVNKSFFTFKSYELKSFNDLNKINDFALANEVKKLILQDHEKWPYKLTNDYEDYKKWSYVKNKKTNRYFINRKIHLKQRVLIPALINKDNQVINIKSF